MNQDSRRLLNRARPLRVSQEQEDEEPKYLDLTEVDEHRIYAPPPRYRALGWRDRIAIAVIILVFLLVLGALCLGVREELRWAGRLVQ